MAVRPPPPKPPPKRRRADPTAPTVAGPAPSGPRRGGAAGAPSSRRKPEPPEPREEIPSLELDDVLDGKYRLLEQLDEGGMGSVFVAHNEALDVPVAVKVIRSDLTGQAKAKLGERLLQEARAAARLGHPAIVRAMDFGTAPNGDPYLVMELLDGEDLATGLDQRGRVSPTKAVRIVLPIVHALATAHDKGIVHRDLKPENVILCPTETGQVQPKLIDFGIAKMHRPRTERITMVGDALGTPEYMSPEQARGEDVDALTDVWATCVMLYEMVTDVLPFEANNYHALLRAIIEDDPLPITALGVQNETLSAIVQKGLAKDKSDRWPSMRALGTALATWLAELGITEDICGTSLRATWLKSPSYDSLDVLSSLPPPPPAPDRPLAAPAGGVAAAPSERSPAIEIAPASTRPPSEAVTPAPAGGVDAPSSDRLLEPPVSSAAPVAESSPDDAVEASTARPAAAPARRSWLLVALWVLTLTGMAWAVTGYLQIALPGLPTRVQLPSALADLLGLDRPVPAQAEPAVPTQPPEPAVASSAPPTAATDSSAAAAADGGPSADASSTASTAATATAPATPAPARRPTPRLKRPTFD